MFELRHLRYFVAVAEELSFSRAAKRLRMAQPPLSVAIRELEGEVGAALFNRTSREVRLTEVGEVFLVGARRTLLEADAAIAAVSRAAAGELGELRLAYSWSARFETLPLLGRAFTAEAPAVELRAEEMWNADMPSALRSGAIDVALSICPEIADELAYQLVRREPLMVILSPAHRLAAHRSIRLDELADDELVIFPRELAPRLYDFHFAICRAAGFEPKHTDQSLHTLLTLETWEAQSVSFVPRSVSNHLPRSVVAVPLASADRFETHLVWRAEDGRATLATLTETGRVAFGDEAPSLAK